MGVGLAAAILIIGLFCVFVLWGRSAAGKSTLERVYGFSEAPSGKSRSRGAQSRRPAAPAPARRARRTTKASTGRATGSRSASTTARRSSSGPRAAGKRGGEA